MDAKYSMTINWYILCESVVHAQRNHGLIIGEIFRESSKNKKTILNGKPLYGYDQAKKKNYFRHIQRHNKLTKQWRNNPGKLSKAQISNIVIRAVIIMFIILFVLSFL